MYMCVYRQQPTSFEHVQTLKHVPGHIRVDLHISLYIHRIHLYTGSSRPASSTNGTTVRCGIHALQCFTRTSVHVARCTRTDCIDLIPLPVFRYVYMNQRRKEQGLEPHPRFQHLHGFNTQKLHQVRWALQVHRTHGHFHRLSACTCALCMALRGVRAQL